MLGFALLTPTYSACGEWVFLFFTLKICQPDQREYLCRVLGDPLVTRFPTTKLALDGIGRGAQPVP
jgi:hypothetical protein